MTDEEKGKQRLMADTVFGAFSSSRCAENT